MHIIGEFWDSLLIFSVLSASAVLGLSHWPQLLGDSIPAATIFASVYSLLWLCSCSSFIISQDYYTMAKMTRWRYYMSFIAIIFHSAWPLPLMSTIGEYLNNFDGKVLILFIKKSFSSDLTLMQFVDICCWLCHDLFRICLEHRK